MTATWPTPPPPPLSIYPRIHPGGSLLIAWQLRGKRVLIVGGGEVAAGRLRSVLEADANVTLIAPSAKLHPEVRYRVFSDPQTVHRITYHDRTFQFPSFSPTENDFDDLGELEGVDLVLTAIDDVNISRRIHTLAHDRKIPINVADIPPSCDFYFGSQIRSGPLQIMVSTNGKGPKLANIIRTRVEERISDLSGRHEIGQIIEKVGLLRERLRERAPEVGGALGRRRMKWMTGICETWSLDELGEMDDEMMEALLDEGWEKGAKVLPFAAVGGVHAVGKDLSSRMLEWASIDHVMPLLAGITLGSIGSWYLLRSVS